MSQVHPGLRKEEVMPLFGFAGGNELLIVAIVVLVLFGGTRIPSLMKGMGQGIREFRKELKGSEAEDQDPK